MFEHWGDRKVVISLQVHKKRTTLRKRRQQPLDLKRVTAWAGAVSAVLLAVKLLAEIIKLILPH